MSIGDAVWWIFAALCISGVATDWQYRRSADAAFNLLGMVMIWVIPFGFVVLMTYILS